MTTSLPRLPAARQAGAALLALALGHAWSAGAADFTCQNAATGTWSDTDTWALCNGGIPNNTPAIRYGAIIGSGVVTLDQHVTLDGLDLQGGTVNGNFDIHIENRFGFDKGTHSGGGTTEVRGSLVLGTDDVKEIGGNGFDGDGVGRTLLNAAGSTTQWTDGDLLLSDSDASFTNLGSVEVTTNKPVVSLWGPGTFSNQGSFTLNTGAANQVFNLGPDTRFANTGTVTVTRGALRLIDDAIHGGIFTTGADGKLVLFRGQHGFRGDLSDAALELDQGSVIFDTPIADNTLKSLAFSSLYSPSSADFSTGEHMTLGSLSQVGGTVTGSDTLTITGLFAASGGTHAGAGSTEIRGDMDLSSEGTFTITGDGTSGNGIGRTLTNAAGSQVRWLDGVIDLAEDDAAFVNQGDLSIGDGTTMASYGHAIQGQGRLDNQGTMTLNLADAADRFAIGEQVALSNTGTIKVDKGVLELGGTVGGTLGGTIVTADSGLVEVSRNTWSFTGDQSAARIGVSGLGSEARFTAPVTGDSIGGLEISAGTARVDTGNPVSIETLTQSGGTLTGDDDVLINGVYQFNGGEQTGTGTTRVQSYLNFGLADDGFAILRGDGNIGNGIARTLEIDSGATASFDRGTIILSEQGSTLRNLGQLDIGHASATQTNHDFFGSGLVDNQGTITLDLGDPELVVRALARLDNQGLVDTVQGELRLERDGTHGGRFRSSGGFVSVASGTQTFDGADLSGADLRITGGRARFSADASGGPAGALSLDSGTLEVASGVSLAVSDLTQTGGGREGAGTIEVRGTYDLRSGTLAGSGTTRVTGSLTIETDNALEIGGDGFPVSSGVGHTLINAAGAVAEWTGGDIRFTDPDARLLNQGTLSVVDDSTAASGFFASIHGVGTLDNTGTIEVTLAPGTHAANIGPDTRFNNSGTLRVNRGELRLIGDGSHTGSFVTAQEGLIEIRGGTHGFSGADLTDASIRYRSGSANFDAPLVRDSLSEVIASGADLSFSTGRTVTIANLTHSDGTLSGSDDILVTGSFKADPGVRGGTLGGSGTLTALGGIDNSGAFYRIGGDGIDENGTGRTLVNGAAGTTTMNRGSIRFEDADAVFRNLGTFNAGDGTADTDLTYWITAGNGTFDNQGSLNVNLAESSDSTVLQGVVLNSGVLNIQKGILSVEDGLNGVGGTIRIAAGAGLVIPEIITDSSVARLEMASGASLVLDHRDLIVHDDYSNADFGTGNSFNARANITGNGEILAAGGLSQSVTGDVVGGSDPTVTMSFGNHRVGDGSATLSFEVINSGTGAVPLRGAVQDTGISDPRLSGPGAFNFGPLDPGQGTGTLQLSFDTGSVDTQAAAAGALTNQSLAAVNGFTNVSDQVIQVTGAAYLKARGTLATQSLDLGAFHTGGGSLGGTIAVSNTAADTGGFTEGLALEITTASGVSVVNNASLVAAETTLADGLVVNLDRGSAGDRSGRIDLSRRSTGSGTSGLSATDQGTDLGDLSVVVSAQGYHLAAGAAGSDRLDLGALRVGDTGAQTQLTLSNSAPQSAGFTETLAVSLSGLSGPLAVSANQVSGISAGGPASGVTLSMASSQSGAFSQNLTLDYRSNEVGGSGLGTTDLSDGTVVVTGRVYQQAQANVGTTAIDLGLARVGDAPSSRAVAVTNSANGDLVDLLRGSITTSDLGFGAAGDLGSGIAAGDSDAASLTVFADTDRAGHFSGQAVLELHGHNDEMADDPMTAVRIALDLQVNNQAQPSLLHISGDGSLSRTPSVYTLDLGRVMRGSSALLSASLSLENTLLQAGIPQDALQGAFIGEDNAQGAFSFTYFDAFIGLAPGQSLSDLLVSFDPGSLAAGSYSGSITLDADSVYTGLADLNLTQIRLNVLAEISGVPVPHSLLLLVPGLALVALAVRRRPPGEVRRLAVRRLGIDCR